jgi:phenylpropionate dioxygenase-like ring-hydroxylating dioxygenase large terminal subunit
MRRYWTPAALAEEIPPGGAPVSLRLLGEELVLFRDDRGRLGLLGLHCSHRGADLSYGRVEDGGLRCIYHGWLYDIRGRCLDQPGEPGGGANKDSIRHPAYPCVEKAGVIFTYMGPGEPPLFPNYEFLAVPDEQAFGIKLFHECNYLQANEGNIDLAHLSFLHYSKANRGVEFAADGSIDHRGAAPELETYEVELTDYGLRSYKIRKLKDPDYYRLFMTEFVLPSFTCFFGEQYAHEGACSVNWHVPIDDFHHWKYTFIFSRKGPLDKEAIRKRRADMDADYSPKRKKKNRYDQDRALMAGESFTGIGYNFQVQDVYATESMGAMQDRSKEHLATMDRSVVAARKIMFKAIRDLQEGREPANVVRDPSRNFFLLDASDDAVPVKQNWKDYMVEKTRKLKIVREGSRG